MASFDYDLIVIGSGQGGAIAAQHVAKAGKKVAIVESGTFGGSEVSAGIVPIAALQQSAAVYETAKHGSRFGVRGATIGYNYPTVKAWKDLVVKRTGIHSGEDAFNAMGINVIHGRAYFIDPHTITIGAARFTSQEFLLATGTEAILPDVTGLAKSGFLTVHDVLGLTRPPKKLAVIGGGQYSYEISQFFAALGSKVYIIESGAAIAANEEPEVATLLHKILEDRYSVSIATSTTVETVATSGYVKKLTLRRGGKTSTITVDEIVLATEQKAVVDIGLENAGVAYSGSGIAVSPSLQTSARHIFAAGGCTDTFDAGHSAAYQSQVAAHNILHPKRAIATDKHALPRLILTSPAIVAVGATEKELSDAHIPAQSVYVPLSVVPQANIADFSDGFVKILAHKRSGILLGATVAAPHAAEVAQELVLAIQHHLTARDLAHTAHSFPSWSEAVRVACSKLARG